MLSRIFFKKWEMRFGESSLSELRQIWKLYILLPYLHSIQKYLRASGEIGQRSSEVSRMLPWAAQTPQAGGKGCMILFAY